MRRLWNTLESEELFHYDALFSDQQHHFWNPLSGSGEELFSHSRGTEMRLVKGIMMLSAVLVASSASTSWAGRIGVMALGATNAANVIITEGDQSADLTYPSGTLTIQAVFGNTSLSSSDTIQFAGLTFSISAGNFRFPLAVSSLLSFTTSAGSFTFDSVEGKFFISHLGGPINSRELYELRTLGTLSGGGFLPTPGSFSLFFTIPDGSYGYGLGVSFVDWYLHTTVPEPSSMILAGLGACGVVWQVRRRQAHA